MNFLKPFFLYSFLLIAGSLPAVTVKRSNEWGIFQILKTIVPKDPTVVYGGGHEGEDVRILSNLWPKGEIYTFEPNPAFYEPLKIRTSNLKNVRIFPFALSEHTGTATFYLTRNEANPRIGSLLPAKDQWRWYYNDEEAISVQSVNLQDWGSSRLNRIDLIWLDVGGAELQVLQSIPKYLPEVAVIVVETQFQEFREKTGTYSEMKPFLEDNDFEEIFHWHTKGFHGLAVFAKKGSVEVQR